MAALSSGESTKLLDALPDEVKRILTEQLSSNEGETDLSNFLANSLITGQIAQKALFQFNLPSIFKGILDFVSAAFGNVYKTVTDFVIDGLLGNDVLPDEFKARVKHQFESMGVLGPVMSIVLGAGMGLEAVKHMMNLAGVFVERDFNLTFRMKEVDARSLIRSVYVNPSTFAKVKLALQRSGYTDEDITLMLRAEHSPLPMDVIRSLTLQSIFSPEQTKGRLHEQGYTDSRIQAILNSWKHVLSASELLEVARRGGTSEALNNAFDLDAGYPSNWNELMAKNGYSAEDAAAIWRGHWTLPDARSALLMREQGFISEEMYRLILGYSGLVPSQIDNVTKVNYSLIPFRALAQMHNEGILDDEALMREIVAHGFGDERAKLIFTWIKENVAGTRQAATEARILEAYRMHAMSRTDAKTSLVNIHYSDSDAEWLLDDEDVKAQIAEKKEREATVRDSFEGRLIDEAEARAELVAMDYAPTYIDALIGRWSVRRTLTVALPSKSDLNDFRSTGIINDETYITYMEKLRYPPEVIAWYMALPVTKKAASAALVQRKQNQALVQKSVELEYKAATIDETSARSKLSAAGLAAALIDLLLLEWTPARAAALAKAQAAAQETQGGA